MKLFWRWVGRIAAIVTIAAFIITVLIPMFNGYGSIVDIEEQYVEEPSYDDISSPPESFLHEPMDICVSLPLKKGESGTDIWLLHISLNTLGFWHPQIPYIVEIPFNESRPDLVALSVFCQLTKEAVLVFQGLVELDTTGIVDYVTWRKIMLARANPHIIAHTPMPELPKKFRAATDVNFRTKPSADSSIEIITLIMDGTQVLVRDYRDFEWLLVEHNGHVGYIRTRHLRR